MSDLQSLIIFILIGVGFAGILGDCYTTSEGLSYGFTEKNSVARRMMKLIGPALTTFVGGALYVFSSVILGEFVSPLLGLAFAAGIAGVEIFNTIRNYGMYSKSPNYKNKVRIPVVY